jgi:hypothetical protein
MSPADIIAEDPKAQAMIKKRRNAVKDDDDDNNNDANWD